MKPIYTFSIDSLPPSVNHIWRTTWTSGHPRFYKDKKAREFEEIAFYQLRKTKKPISVPLELRIVFTFKSEKRFAIRDLDNCLKLIPDMLTNNSIIEDDSLITKIVCEKKTGKSNSSVGSLYAI